MGHRVIAQIAYEHLTPTARHQVDQLTRLLDKHHHWSGVVRFVRMSAWPDQWRENGMHQFDAWHYIDLNASVSSPKTPNIVWAIEHINAVLKCGNSSIRPYKRAILLVLLIHLVGDIHQPLHTTSRVSALFPDGDEGGNLYPIQVPSTNLHTFWDKGLGLLTDEKIYPVSRFLHFVASIESQFNERALKEPGKIDHSGIDEWAQESAKLAWKYAYRVREHGVPSLSYIHQGRYIVRQRLALAGYRLAYLINSEFH